MRKAFKSVIFTFGILALLGTSCPVFAAETSHSPEKDAEKGVFCQVCVNDSEETIKNQGAVLFSVSVPSNEEAGNTVDEEIRMMEEDLLSELDLDEIDRVLESDDSTAAISFSDILNQILDSDGEIFKRDMIQQLISLAFSDLSECKTLFIQILLMTIAFAFLNNFINMFENSQISKTGFYMYFLVLMVLLVKSYLLMDHLLQQVLGQTVELMQAVIPAFCMTMIFMSARTSATIFYQIAVVVIWLVERLLCYVIAPGVHIYVILQMLNCMTSERMISRVTLLLKKILKWSLRAMLAGVTGMNIIENMIAPSMDNLKKLSITKTLGLIPGLGGTAEAVSNIFLGSAAVIKNGVGTAIMIVLVCIALGPMMKMIVFALFYKLAGAIVQPFADKRVCGCIDSVGEGAGMLLKTMVTGILLFMITIAIVITGAK